jgi:hypothetical protein
LIFAVVADREDGSAGERTTIGGRGGTLLEERSSPVNSWVEADGHMVTDLVSQRIPEFLRFLGLRTILLRVPSKP